MLNDAPVLSASPRTQRITLQVSRDFQPRQPAIDLGPLQAPVALAGEQTASGATALAGCAFGGTVHALWKGRRTMACMISSLFLFAMFGVVAAAVTFMSGTKEKPSARQQETPAARSCDHVIA
jgi:hypothetical protein